MPWNRWYSFKSYVRSALWLVPFLAIVVGIAVKRASEWFGNWGGERGIVGPGQRLS